MKVERINSSIKPLRKTGVIGYDPRTKKIYFSNGTEWLEIASTQSSESTQSTEKHSTHKEKTDSSEIINQEIIEENWDPAPSSTTEAINRVANVVAPLVGGKIA